MGQCQSSPNPTAAQIAQIPIGGTVTLTATCYAQPATDYINCATYLQTSEFGDDTSVSNGSGANLQCTRLSFNGDPTTCCLGQTPASGTTCNPIYNSPSNSACSGYLQTYCTGSNLTSSPCISWGASNQAQYISAMNSFCGQNNNMATNSTCRAFAQSSEAQGQMDAVMATYCATAAGKADTLCSCVNSSIPCPNKFDSRCVSNIGYETHDMQTETCPSIIDCSQQINLSPSDLSAITGVTIQQNCTSNTTTSTGTSTTSTPSAAAGTSSSSSSNEMYIIYAIAFIIVIFLIMYALSDDDDQTKSVTGSGQYSYSRK